MKTSTFSSLFLIALLLSPLAAQEAPVPLNWTSKKGQVKQGIFVRIEGESVVIQEGGKPITLPFTFLSQESITQAKELAAAVEVNLKEGPPIKQTDPDHQRKLALSIVGKKGAVEIWRGSGSLRVTSLEELPKGILELKSVSLGLAPFTEEDVSMLRGCDRLEYLGFSQNTIPMLPLDTLRGLINLNFDRCRISSDTLKNLGGNNMLRSVSFWRTPVADGSELVKALESCPNLESISFCHTGMGNTSLEPLARLKKLKSLYLDGTRFSGSELSAIGKMQAIERLALWHCNLMEMDFGILANLKNLGELYLGGCKLPPNALQRVAGIPALVRLELAESDVTSEMLVTLGGMKSLRYLGLDSTAIAPESLIHFKPFPSLEEICLRGKATQVSDNGVTAVLKACPNLKVFNVNASRMGPAGFARLTDFKMLRALRLTDAMSLPDSSVLALSRSGEVDFLDLSRSAITDSQIALLIPMKRQLGELYLYGTRITDASIPALKEMKALRRIDVSGTDISKTGVSDLRKGLASCRVDY